MKKLLLWGTGLIALTSVCLLNTGCRESNHDFVLAGDMPPYVEPATGPDLDGNGIPDDQEVEEVTEETEEEE